jgi:hypothetical protein
MSLVHLVTVSVEAVRFSNFAVCRMLINTALMSLLDSVSSFLVTIHSQDIAILIK